MSRTYAEIEHQVGRLRRLLDGLDPHSTEPEDVIELRRAGHAVLLDRRAHRRRLGHRRAAPRAALLQLATPDLTRQQSPLPGHQRGRRPERPPTAPASRQSSPAGCPKTPSSGQQTTRPLRSCLGSGGSDRGGMSGGVRARGRGRRLPDSALSVCKHPRRCHSFRVRTPVQR